MVGIFPGIASADDSDAFLEIMPEAQGEILGARAFLAKLHQEFPDMVIGSFSHYVEE